MEITHFTLYLLHCPQYASASDQQQKYCRMTGHISLQQPFQFGQRIDISLVIPVAEDFPLTMSMIVDKCMLFIFFPSRLYIFIPSSLLVDNPSHSPMHYFLYSKKAFSVLCNGAASVKLSQGLFTSSHGSLMKAEEHLSPAVSLFPSHIIVLLTIFTKSQSKFI